MDKDDVSKSNRVHFSTGEHATRLYSRDGPTTGRHLSGLKVTPASTQLWMIILEKLRITMSMEEGHSLCLQPHLPRALVNVAFRLCWQPCHLDQVPFFHPRVCAHPHNLSPARRLCWTQCWDMVPPFFVVLGVGLTSSQRSSETHRQCGSPRSFIRGTRKILKTDRKDHWVTQRVFLWFIYGLVSLWLS